MKRRAFIAGLGSAAVWPLAARAQQRALPVIGFFDPGTADDTSDTLREFHKGLGEAGYFEGRNVTVEYHWLEGQYDRDRRWSPIWSAVVWPSSPRLSSLVQLRPKPRPRRSRSCSASMKTRSG
jgi:hypothetical protein